ncbi:uncharacterized protein LOC116337589 [Contarinia nasturtii]|uniref:uncharacterized protein LOC116337589 n=1 Tax=Contarinia nasturtii TaxID=265458 RepID=UPI0012D42BEA|nr:uncharacterized protein LOC116337589 [Contarinia nasturtii]
MKLKSCCCVNLRTGGLIIAGFEIFLGLVLIRTNISVALVKFAVGGCLMFGILKNQPTCLVPYLIAQGISIVGSIITLIYLIVKMQTNPEETKEFFAELITETTDNDSVENASVDKLIPLIMILSFLLLIESIYSSLVIYSLYKESKVLNHQIQDSINNHIHPALQANLPYESNPPPYSFYPPDQSNLSLSTYPIRKNQPLAFSTFVSQPKKQKNKADNDVVFSYN